MSNSSRLLRAVLCTLLFAAVVTSTTGCSKLKALLARKSVPAAATPAPGQPAGPNPGSDQGTAPVAKAPASTPGVAAPAGAAPTPNRVVAGPAIDKSAAVMVLCYHRLEDKPRPKDTLALTPTEFEKEMQALKDANFSVIPMQDFLAWRRGDKNIPAKSCVITIDDGYVSGYDTAWPILKKFGYPFTMFVYINYVNSGGKSISWDQLAEMRDAGVDIESHTYSHADLRNPNDRTALDKKNFELVQKDVQTLGKDGWMRKEIIDSKKVLEQQLAIKVNAIAYPYGKYDQEVRDIVKEAGYEAGFTVYGQRIGYTSPSFDLIGRYAVDQTNPKVFQDAISMVGGGQGPGPTGTPVLAQLASASMVTIPAEGETISNPKPAIKANLATMGDVDPKSVEMRVSGVGLVPVKYDAASKTASYQVTQNLRDTSCTVIINAVVAGKRVETRWDFKIDPKAAGAAAPGPSTAPVKH